MDRRPLRAQERLKLSAVVSAGGRAEGGCPRCYKGFRDFGVVLRELPIDRGPICSGGFVDANSLSTTHDSEEGHIPIYRSPNFSLSANTICFS
jgi:hypothetical protein